MTNLQTLRQAIQALETHRGDFHDVLMQRMRHDSRLTPTQLEHLGHQRLNHSEIEILSLVNQTHELPYKTLTSQVNFSQGMLSRYVKKLLTAELLVKVPLPNNKKAYDLAITPTGTILAELHDALHREEAAAYNTVLAQFNEAELETTEAVLRAMEQVSLKA